MYVHTKLRNEKKASQIPIHIIEYYTLKYHFKRIVFQYQLSSDFEYCRIHIPKYI